MMPYAQLRHNAVVSRVDAFPKADSFMGSQVLAFERLASLRRVGLPTPNTVYTTGFPVKHARHTLTTSAEMRLETVMRVAGEVSLDSGSLHEYIDLFKVQITRPRTGLLSSAKVKDFILARDGAASNPEWVDNLNSPIEVAQIAKTIKGLFLDLQTNGLEKLDKTLGRIDVQKAHHVHLVAVLRALFRSRSHLSNWRWLRNETFQKIQLLGKDAGKIMAGLNVD